MKESYSIVPADFHISEEGMISLSVIAFISRITIREFVINSQFLLVHRLYYTLVHGQSSLDLPIIS